MKNNVWMRKLDFIFITRPMLFFPGWNTLLAGFLVAQGDVRLWSDFVNNLYYAYPGNLVLLLAMLAFMCGMGGCFILNQLKDVESDQKNRKLFLIGEKYLTKLEARVETVLLLVIAVILAWFVGFGFLIIILMFILTTGYLYNFYPFQFKNYPVSGLLSNALMGWLAFGAGWILVQTVSVDFIIHSSPYLFLNTALYLLTTLPDREGDQLSGKITFSVKYGEKTTFYLAGVFYLLSLILAAILNDQLILILSLLTFYYMLRMLAKKTLSEAVLTVKMSIFFFSFLICFKFPPYFMLMLLVFILTRYYYSKRFQFNYPNFRGE